MHISAEIIHFHDRPLRQIRVKACGTGIHWKISFMNSFPETNLCWPPRGCSFDQL